MSAIAAPRYVFTLVHGTWARMPWQRKTAWIQPDAWFATELRKRLGEGVTVIPFEWGGWNNHTSRARASCRLIDQLRGTPGKKGTLDQFPNAKHYLICHSHGGNVAMYALATAAGLHERIAGVACLATPFLIARKRDLGGKTSEHIGVLLLVLAALGYAAVQTLSFWNSWPVLAGAGAKFGAVMVFIGAMMSMTYASNELARALRAAMSHAADLKPEKLLIIRAPGDEASSAFGFFQFISQVSMRVFLLFTRLNTRLERWTDRWPAKSGLLALTALAGFAGFMIAAVAGVGLWMRFECVWLLAPAVLCAAAGVLISLEAAGRLLSSSTEPIRLGTFVFRVVAGTVLLPVLTLLSVLLVPFGAKYALASLFLDVTAETTPMGAWNVHQIPSFVAVDGNVPLSHSGVYGNPEAIRHICTWIAPKHTRKRRDKYWR